MKIVAIALAAIGFSIVSIACNAGVAPSHDTSQLSQSGAKIAPPKKDSDSAKKDEKEQEKDQDRDQKR